MIVFKFLINNKCTLKSVCIKSSCTKTHVKPPEELKDIASIKFLEFFWTKCILFCQNWLNIIQDISQNTKMVFNFLLDFSESDIKDLRQHEVVMRSHWQNFSPTLIMFHCKCLKTYWVCFHDLRNIIVNQENIRNFCRNKKIYLLCHNWIYV